MGRLEEITDRSIGSTKLQAAQYGVKIEIRDLKIENVKIETSDFPM